MEGHAKHVDPAHLVAGTHSGAVEWPRD